MELSAFIQAVIGAAFGALGAYVAIRSDIANLQARMKTSEEALVRAHDRIDAILRDK